MHFDQFYSRLLIVVNIHSMEENGTQFWGDCVSKVCPGIKQSMMLSLAKFPLTIL